jgi:hypothetical protein
MAERVRLAAWILVVLFMSGVAFGAAVLGIPTVYHWWLQFQCWRAGPDSQECWWLDLLEHPRGQATLIESPSV